MFPSGFFISVDHPYFGASPDGLVCCTCCGTGILEIKVCVAIMLTLIDRCTFIFQCPYCHKDDTLENSASDDDSRFCLEKTQSAQLKLKSTHQYYYQVCGILIIGIGIF